MKWFVIVLLLANVAVFGWQFNERLEETTAAALGPEPLPPNTPGLRLLAELGELPRLRQPAETSGEAIVEAVDLTTELNSFGEASEVCISVGPLENEDQLKTLRTWLRSRATAVHTQQETIRQRQFFWVYLEPASDAEARKNLSDLRRRGVKGYMLIRRGGLKNAISLGLFRSQDSVNRRLAEMTRQGYKPVVVPKFETVENYWVRAILAVGFEDALSVSAGVLGESELKQIDCAAVGDAAARAGM